MLQPNGALQPLLLLLLLQLLLVLLLPMLPVEVLLPAAARRRLPRRPDHSAVVGVRAAGRGGPPRDGTRGEVPSQPTAFLMAPVVLLLLLEVVVAPGAHGGAVEASGLQRRRWTKA